MIKTDAASVANLSFSKRKRNGESSVVSPVERSGGRNTQTRLTAKRFIPSPAKDVGSRSQPTEINTVNTVPTDVTSGRDSEEVL